MLIKVFYRSGRLDAFDTVSFCTSKPFKRRGDNLLTEFQLLTDSETLLSEGLILEVYWYDPCITDSTRRSGQYNLPHAARQAGNRIRLASRSEIEDIVLITVDGELMLWRQGEYLINGVKFKNQEILCYSNEVTASINRRALALYDYVRNANPKLNEEQAASLLGYTKEAIDDISFAESANAEFAEDFADALDHAVVETFDENNAKDAEAENETENWDFS